MAEEQETGRERTDANVLRKLLQHVPLTVSQTVIISHGPQVIAHRGALKQVEAADAAIFVAEGWRDVGQTLRIQFMPLPLSSSSRLLVTYALPGGYQLTLVDHEDASLDQLRHLARQLLAVLQAAGLGRPR